MNHYNGYTPEERNRKLRAMHERFPNRSHPYYAGPCHMCGDPNCPVAPHSEDYSEPYLWEKPAVYALCKTCHGRLHKRFASPEAWEAYKRHLRRGGYGSDLKRPVITREVSRLAKMLPVGNGFGLSPLRERQDAATPWWEILSTDVRVLTAPWARRR
jgi:hypothetical protein